MKLSSRIISGVRLASCLQNNALVRGAEIKKFEIVLSVSGFFTRTKDNVCLTFDVYLLGGTYTYCVITIKFFPPFASRLQ